MIKIALTCHYFKFSELYYYYIKVSELFSSFNSYNEY